MGNIRKICENADSTQPIHSLILEVQPRYAKSKGFSNIISLAQLELKKHTYFPSGSVSLVHSFNTLPSNFHGNLHSAFLSGLSLVVRHI